MRITKEIFMRNIFPLKNSVRPLHTVQTPFCVYDPFDRLFMMKYGKAAPYFP